MKSKTFFSFLSVIVIILTIAGFLQGQENNSEASNEKLSLKKLIKSAHNELLNENYDKALIFADSAYSIDSSSSEVSYYRANAIVNLGDTSQGIIILSNALKLVPYSTKLKLFLIRIYLQQGNAAEVVNYSDQILAIRPNEGEALYLKGLGLISRGDTTKAIELFDKAILNSMEK